MDPTLLQTLSTSLRRTQRTLQNPAHQKERHESRSKFLDVRQANWTQRERGEGRWGERGVEMWNVYLV
jgi:hypothetical protein